MNTYTKYCPNVYVAKCTERHQKDDIIIVTTQYGKENECYIHNLVIEGKDGFFYYSITRVDGFNSQERARRKAERLESWANSAVNKGEKYYNASKKGAEFLSLGEPIKIGHHSEKKHRALIEGNQRNFGKYIEQENKSNDYLSRTDYWKSLENKIDLSMPESLEFFEYKLEKATAYHQGLKNKTIPMQHSYSLVYANKEVKELTKKIEIAKKLWA